MIVNLAEPEADRSRSRHADIVLETGFEAIYREHVDAVYRYCLAQLCDPTAAEDCTAEAFAAALAASRRGGLVTANVRPWLFRIARNTSIDWIRRERVRGRFLDRAHGSDTTDVETVVEMRSELQGAVDAISRLSKRERALVGLRVAAGLSYSEIALVLGMKENAARMATARALARIRMEASRDA